MSIKLKYIKSSGNVFEDLGFKDSEERIAKSQLAICIHDVISRCALSQKEAAEILGINQPKVSALVNGRLEGFSLERLISFLNRLDQDVQIVVKQKSPKKDHGSFSVANI